MLLFFYAVLAVVTLVVVPFWHIIGLGLFSALLFWGFHINPAFVFAFYIVATVVRSTLFLLGLAGIASWFSRKTR